MSYFTIFISPLLFFLINGERYTHFNWEDFPTDCGMTKYNDTNLGNPKSELVTPARIGEFPWLARIGLRDDDTGVLFFYCTGSLIHANYVITAAHCGSQGKMVRLGETNLANQIDCYRKICAPPVQDIGIKNHMFAKHCRMNNTNDMSLLVLKKPAILNDFVRPICFPQIRMEHNEPIVVAGWSVIYSGWGTVHGQNYRSINDLKYMKSSVVDPQGCSTAYKSLLDESELCVAYPEEVGDSCVIDSGGPLVQYVGREKRAYLIGIASHDLLTCYIDQGDPIIYTDVYYFGNWVMQRINQWIHWGA